MGTCCCCCCCNEIETGCKEHALMDKLEGSWYIKQTTFPMWLDGKKLSPTLNYTKQTNKYGDVILYDNVMYTENKR